MLRFRSVVSPAVENAQLGAVGDADFNLPEGSIGGIFRRLVSQQILLALKAEPEIELEMARRTDPVRLIEEGRGQHPGEWAGIDVVEEILNLRRELKIEAR